MKRLMLTILASLIAQAASADVLFLDMNNSPKEIEAARRAAAKRKERLVVLPAVKPEIKKQIDRLTAEQRKLVASYQSCQRGGGNCRALNDKIYVIGDQLSRIMPRFTAKNLDEQLAAIAKSKAAISSIVISGHDGSGHFSGAYGSITDQALAGALGKYPNLKDSLRSLHLWGCYTTEIGSIEMNWKKNFPGIALITGYNGTAPANDKPAGWTYLEGVLSKEKDLIEAGDAKKLKKLFDSIENIGLVKAAICANDIYVTKDEAVNLSEMYQRCAEQISKAKEQYEGFKCFLHATEEKCEDPPENTQTGPMREFYNTLQATRHCSTAPQFAPDMQFLPSVDHVIRVIYTKNLKKNFAKHYGVQISEVDQMLREIGASPALQFGGLEKMTRGEIIRKLQELKMFLDEKSMGNDPDDVWNVTDEAQKVASLRHFVEAVQSNLIEPSPHCVPFSWVEPGAQERSCVGSDDFGNMKLAEYRSNPDFVMSERVRRKSEALYQKISEIQKRTTDHDRRQLSAEDQVALHQAESESMRLQAELYVRSFPYEIQRMEKMAAAAKDPNHKRDLEQEIQRRKAQGDERANALKTAEMEVRRAHLYADLNGQERPNQSKVLELREMNAQIYYKRVQDELEFNRTSIEQGKAHLKDYESRAAAGERGAQEDVERLKSELDWWQKAIEKKKKRHDALERQLQLARLHREQGANPSAERASRIQALEAEAPQILRTVAEEAYQESLSRYEEQEKFLKERIDRFREEGFTQAVSDEQRFLDEIRERKEITIANREATIEETIQDLSGKSVLPYGSHSPKRVFPKRPVDERIPNESAPGQLIPIQAPTAVPRER